MTHRCRTAGIRHRYTDGLIAATALVHGKTVVTRDVGDFPDVPTIDPWVARDVTGSG